jgi:hypothetical protein
MTDLTPEALAELRKDSEGKSLMVLKTPFRARPHRHRRACVGQG